MQKFCVIGDKANAFFSSSLIITNLNKAAQKLGLFDENAPKIVYSTVGSDYGHQNVAAIICLYELPFPLPILHNLGNRPVIGSGLDNMFFAAEGGYPCHLCYYAPLGVDSTIFTPQKKTHNKFRFLSFAESNSRCGLHLLLDAFGDEFRGMRDVELYIKDRLATPTWKTYVKEKASEYNIVVIHDTENTQDFEQIKKIYGDSDVHVFLNQSSTWALSCCESMAMGLPLIAMNYSGPANYLRDNFNGYAVKYALEEVDDLKINSLIKIGLRNFLFPTASYLHPPYWAAPEHDDLRKSLEGATTKCFDMDRWGQNAQLTAAQFTWERSVVQLSQILDQVDINKKIC